MKSLDESLATLWRRFQFSIGDANSKKYLLRRVGGGRFNSLLEMLETVKVCGDGYVLYSFNSLLEMRGEGENQKIQVGDVSILYWRCRRYCRRM